MSEKMTEKTYRIEGLSCTNCAGKFEKNVKQLPGVTSATVNFGASKISVEGQTTIEELEEAGAFENLIIRDDQENDEQVRSKESFIKRNIALIISLGDFPTIIGRRSFINESSLYIGNNNWWI